MRSDRNLARGSVVDLLYALARFLTAGRVRSRFDGLTRGRRKTAEGPGGGRHRGLRTRGLTSGQPVKAETPSGVPTPVGPSYPERAVHR